MANSQTVRRMFFGPRTFTWFSSASSKVGKLDWSAFSGRLAVLVSTRIAQPASTSEAHTRADCAFTEME